MKKIKPIVAVLTIFLINFSLFSIKGSGTVISEDRSVSKFHSVKINCNAKVRITQGSPQKVTVAIDDNLMENLKTEVNRGELSISILGIATSITKIEIEIVMENVQKLTLNGAGSIRVTNDITTENAEFIINGSGSIRAGVNANYIFSKIFGSGKISLSGSVKNQEIEISGSGEINAFNLTSNTVKATISGAGICKVNPNEMMNIKINGSGEVEYKGIPKIEAKVSGTGSIKYVE